MRMEMNNFQKLIQEREDLYPPELEYQVMRQASTMGHFGDMVSLFVLNTMATVVHIVTGGEEPKCLHDKRQRIVAEMDERLWRQPNAGNEPLPESYGTRKWAVPQSQ